MTDLTYVSLFSGIEAFSVAASRIEGVRWRPVFFSEIEPFPCAVLAHHFPNVPNLGDICNIRVDREKGTITNGDTTIPLPRTGIDILAGGSPCQDVSVAGKRAGMSEGSGTRSSLAFEYARLVEELRPRVVLWENVHGVLSSNGGRDFLAFQRSLVERGYSLAYRVLDAQYARVDGFPLAVPQRRRRVWLVGCLGADESVPAQILFERPGVLGDTPPRRAQGQGSASPPGYRIAEHDRVLGGAGWGASVGNGQLNQTAPEPVAKTLDTMHDAQMIVIAPQSESASFVSGDHKASCDGGDVSNTLPSTTGGFKPSAVAVATFENHGQDSRVREIEVSDTRSRKDGTGGNNLPLVVVGADGYNQTETGNVSKTLGAASTDYHHVPLVCTAPSVCKTLSAEGFDGMPDVQKGNGQPIVTIGFCPEESAKTRSIGAHDETSLTLNSSSIRATAIGFKPGQSGREDTGSLGARMEECPTLPRDPGGMGVGVAVGFSHVASGAMLDCQPKPCATPLKQSPGGEGAIALCINANDVYPNVCIGVKYLASEKSREPTSVNVSQALGAGCNDQAVAIMLKVRCGKDTYIKPDGSIGTAGEGPLVSEESAFTLSATQDQTLILNYIVRLLTPVECERLMGFPDGWTLIPYRGKPADQCPDSPRYKALGNSWATNCAEWVLRRIVAAIRLGMIAPNGGPQP